MNGKRRHRDLRVDIIPQYMPMAEFTDVIIQALWGSCQSAAREFLQKEKEVIGDEHHQ